MSEQRFLTFWTPEDEIRRVRPEAVTMVRQGFHRETWVEEVVLTSGYWFTAPVHTAVDFPIAGVTELTLVSGDKFNVWGDYWDVVRQLEGRR